MKRTSTPKLRKDIRWVEHDSGGFVAEDCIARSYYLLSAREYRIARLMDGMRTIEGILQLVRRESAFFGVDDRWVIQLTERMRGAGLLLNEYPSSNAKNRRASGWVQQVLNNPLAIRVPIGALPNFLVAPLRFLSHWIVSPTWLAIVASAWLLTSFLICGHVMSAPERLISNLGNIDADDAVWLILITLSIKSLHELGHMLACLRFGLRCPEVGIMFLCFVPCFYCDTTEAWRLKSRWHRASIAMAGIYVESMISIGAGIIWLSAQSETERIVAGIIVLGCTIGTVLINGNPCFRYDGYYALSDLWGVPNLAQQASESLKNHLLYLLRGKSYAENHGYGQSLLLTGYATVSFTYRSVVLVGLVWFVWNWFDQLGLGLLAIVILGLVARNILRQINSTIMSTIGELSFPTPRNKLRLAISAMLVFGFLVFLCKFPIKPIAMVSGTVEYSDSQIVHSPVTAILNECRTDKSTAAIREWNFTSFESDMRNHDSQSQLKIQLLKLELAEQLQTIDPTYIAEIPILREIVLESRNRDELLLKEAASLTRFVSDHEIFVAEQIPSPRRLASFGQLHNSKLSIHTSVKGRVIPKGQVLGTISRKDTLSIRAIVPHQEATKILITDQVRFALDAAPFEEISGTVTKIHYPTKQEWNIHLSVVDETKESERVGEESHSKEPHCVLWIRPDRLPDFAMKGQNVTVKLALPESTIHTIFMEWISKRFVIRR